MSNSTSKGDQNVITEKQEHVWQPEIDEIERRRELAHRMGGQKGIDRQHTTGRLTVRERIDNLIDPGTFEEVGMLTANAEYDDEGNLVDATPKNLVVGKGRVNNKKVAVTADDFTIRGGSSETAAPEKMIFIEKYAIEHRIPLIRLVDAAGGSIKLLEKNQSTKIPGYADWRIDNLLATIPVAAAALGPCAGLGALRVVASHFSVMVKETSQVFAGGPQIVLPGIWQNVTKEELGGYKVHAYESGVVDNVADDEYDALRQIKRFMSYMPRSVYHLPPYVETEDQPDRREESLASIVPRDKRYAYDMRKILEAVFDQESLFEIGRHCGSSQITMLGRINGYPVGILANDPYFYGGALTVRSAEKLIRFADMCDTFNIPVICFFDQAGTFVGRDAELKGTVRKSIQALIALAQISVPWCPIFIRRAFGIAGSLYGPMHRASIRYAWPSAYWGSLPIEGGVEAAYKKEIANAEDPVKHRDDLVDYYKKFESPFRSAERFKIEDIIDPRNTRPILCNWVEEAYELLPERLGTKSYTYRV